MRRLAPKCSRWRLRPQTWWQRIVCRRIVCQDALPDVSARYVTYAQANNVNFGADIVRLSTGDGAVVAFTFDGLHDLHLEFARSLVHAVSRVNQQNPCARFAEAGWCNCHVNFNLRAGVAEGRGVIYRDLTGGYNVAGTAVNLAARVMGEADRQQILFTDAAYTQMIDLVDDVNLGDHFREYTNVRIKHNERITLYQYIDEGRRLD